MRKRWTREGGLGLFDGWLGARFSFLGAAAMGELGGFGLGSLASGTDSE